MIGQDFQVFYVMTPSPFNPAVYDQSRNSLETGNLALWRPTSLAGQIISRWTEGPYSHVGSISWAFDVLESQEQLQFYGGRTCNLSALVRQWPGACDIYRLPQSDEFHIYHFAEQQRRRAGEPYGWWDLLGIAGRIATKDLVRMPWRKRLCEVDRSRHPDLWIRLYSVPTDVAAFCSESVVSDLRAAGFPILPAMAAWEVSPNDVASVGEYVCTLFETQEQVDRALARFEARGVKP